MSSDEIKVITYMTRELVKDPTLTASHLATAACDEYDLWLRVDPLVPYDACPVWVLNAAYETIKALEGAL